ncbi:hypothetical protein PIB30_031839 [Stylosanthes scabra]|uniref:Uncharacterized protein n=1 Tax=Stylosanthes scabra TaxID=79078 RepID=A0ABU6SCH7_9FABA|nr:hypothetical protein [Stylosanthes scabra]
MLSLNGGGVCDPTTEAERTLGTCCHQAHALILVITVVNPCRRDLTLASRTIRIAVTDLTSFLPIRSYGGLASFRTPKKGLKKACREWGSIPSIYRPPLGLKFPFWPSFCLLSTLRCVRIGDETCRARHSCLDAYASSTYTYAYKTIIYCCEALDVRFLMALEPSHLDLCSSSYAQISDKRSGLTVLGDF